MSKRHLAASSLAACVPLGLLMVLGAALFGQLAAAPTGRVELAGYASSLHGRSRNQKRNARLAAAALDGSVIRPGAVFSFNQKVKGWSQDEGYVKAPVSFDGELVRAYGGGVCQTSTTLYNAALLVGLPILERHPHVFRPAYAAPGRDAAVAYPGVDLRFKNPYPWPIRISAKATGDTLSIGLWGREKSAEKVQVQSEIVSATAPARLTRPIDAPGRARRNYLRSPGLSGCRAVAWRVFSREGREVRREKLSDDSYPVMNRIVALAR